MSKMKELYDKIAEDLTLQETFFEIMDGAEVAGEDATKQKLISFAKDAGYDVTLDEMKEFFQEAAVSKDRALTEAELDMVAGGKGTNMFTGMYSKLKSQGNKWADDPEGMLKFYLGF